MTDDHAGAGGVAPAYRRLEDHYRRIRALDDAIGLLNWDRQVMMPAGGAETRSATLAALRVMRHQAASAPELGELLARAGEEPLGHWQAANLAEMRRRHLHATALAEDLVDALSRATSHCETVWQERARPDAEFAAVSEALSRVVALTREAADARAERLGTSPYDALLDAYEPGGRSGQIDTLFAGLEPRLAALLDRRAKTTAPPTATVSRWNASAPSDSRSCARSVSTSGAAGSMRVSTRFPAAIRMTPGSPPGTTRTTGRHR